jgi:hypothetical protein
VITTSVLHFYYTTFGFKVRRTWDAYKSTPPFFFASWETVAHTERRGEGPGVAAHTLGCGNRRVVVLGQARGKKKKLARPYLKEQVGPGFLYL